MGTEIVLDVSKVSEKFWSSGNLRAGLGDWTD